MGWFDERFLFHKDRHKTNCKFCGREMWLPKCKVNLYKTCGGDCAAGLRGKEAKQRERNCKTCGNAFIPRTTQIAAGQGIYCSNKCSIPALLEKAHAPEAYIKSVQTKKDRVASGELVYKKGPENKQWTGGQKAAQKRRKDSGKAKEYNKVYRKRNPHKMREWAQKRRHGMDMPRLPWGTIPKLGDAQKWKCAVCKKSIKRGYHVDHIIPIALGGKHEPLNLQLLCQKCNLTKSAKHPVDYMRERGFLL